MRSLALVLASPLVALALAGCADETAILVEVSSAGVEVPTDVNVLAFTVESDAGTRFSQAYPITELPQSLTLLPASDADRDVTITVEGLQGGALALRRVVRSSFVPGSTVRVSVTLDGACLGVACPEGVDCVAGMCASPLPDGGMPDAGPPGFDAGPRPDGGMDAGRIDGGGVDGGRMDGGRPDAGRPDAGRPDAGGTPVLLFSEYVEGTSNNKALEITNVGDGTADLSTCLLRRYTNGGTTPTNITLSGSLAPGAELTLCNSSIVVGSGRCDILNGAVNHNGDDAYELECSGTLVDSFGQVGFDPGTEWTGGGLGTADFVLRRACAVMTGDRMSMDVFDPSVGWMGMAYADPAASHAGLGSRAECP